MSTHIHVLTCTMPVLVCMVHVSTSVCVWFCICITCKFACMIVQVITCMSLSLQWIVCACIVATRKVAPVPSLQALAVVQPLMLLQMVGEVALVQPLDPQWPTPVTKGTPCKETAHVPAWPMDSGVGSLLVVDVSILAKHDQFRIHNDFDASNV